MKWTILAALAAATVLVLPGAARAEGYPWQDHGAPFDFLFGNHFDMHQQSLELGDGSLIGFRYVEFTGAVTPDGYPVAVHGQETVGWTMHGLPGRARLVQLGEHHPVWLADADDLPVEPGYVHFHWVGGPLTEGDLGETFDGYFLKHTAVTAFFFPEHEAVVTPGIDEAFAPNIVTDWP